jgi:hypothetical protein
LINKFKINEEISLKKMQFKEFKPDVYGKYCSGSAYILTGDLPPLMYETSLHIRFFWVNYLALKKK